ncbi:MAG TPA: ABC transporter ATP-binding protein [Clostridia bacterium]|nr:ABC transporter ATP-binding protein [Clostridia bacterium]
MSVRLLHATKQIKGITVLSDVNFEMDIGKIYGLWGRNGSGKTMLLRLIAGLIRPTHGEVHVFGKRLGVDADFPENMGIIIENVGFWPEYTGMECLRILASIRKKIGEGEMRQVLSRVGLDPDDKRRYRQYSLGMKQKLAIAQAIMEKPNLILLDEPTNSLDTESVKNVRSVLIEERARGALIVVASHNQEDIELLADETIRIVDGKVQ